MITALYVVMQLLIALPLDLLVEHGVDYELDVKGMMVRMTCTSVVYSLLLAPSIRYMCFCYIPVFYIIIIYSVVRYEEVGTDIRSYEIEYREDLSIMESSIGMRFINKEIGLVSIFSLNFYTYNTDKLTDTATQGQSNFELSKKAEIDKENFSIKVGFGMLL